MTSALVPWNTCGAYISGVLGVPTLTYLPFCFFNLLSPVLDVLFAFIGFKVPTIHPSEPTSPEPARATGRSIQPPREEVADVRSADGWSGAHDRGEEPLHAPVRVHDPLLPDRPGRARHVVRPVRHVRAERGRGACPRHVPRGRIAPARIVVDSLTAPINGLYGIENQKGNINYYNRGTLFGAIDVALFIIVIGGSSA